jgi:hypothetical protein
VTEIGKKVKNINTKMNDKKQRRLDTITKKMRL